MIAVQSSAALHRCSREWGDHEIELTLAVCWFSSKTGRVVFRRSRTTTFGLPATTAAMYRSSSLFQPMRTSGLRFGDSYTIVLDSRHLEGQTDK